MAVIQPTHTPNIMSSSPLCRLTRHRKHTETGLLDEAKPHDVSESAPQIDIDNHPPTGSPNTNLDTTGKKENKPSASYRSDHYKPTRGLIERLTSNTKTTTSDSSPAHSSITDLAKHSNKEKSFGAIGPSAHMKPTAKATGKKKENGWGGKGKGEEEEGWDEEE